MVSDYERTISYAAFERRALNAARSTIFVAGFGIPALLSNSRPTEIAWLDGFGIAGLFCLGFILSRGFSKNIRERQLRDVAISEYGQEKLSDLANKKFQQSHEFRMHNETIKHLNKKIDFSAFKGDHLQSLATKGFVGASAIIIGVNIATMNLPAEEINYKDKMDDLVDVIQETIGTFIQENVLSQPNVKPLTNEVLAPR